MGRIDTTNVIVFSICLLGGWDDGQGGTIRTRHFESNHGRKNGQTNLA